MNRFNYENDKKSLFIEKNVSDLSVIFLLLGNFIYLR